jgi:hypothetical protein
MPEQAPPEYPREPRFTELYDASDKLVSDVGSQSIPGRETAGRRPVRPSRNFGVLARVAIDETLRDYALRLADGDARRLVLRADGSVIIANNHKQARRALKDRTFGSVEASDTTSRLDDYE